MPQEVATEVAKNEKVIDQMPGVLVKAEDGSLKKIVTPGVEMPLPDFKPEPTRLEMPAILVIFISFSFFSGLTRALKVF